MSVATTNICPVTNIQHGTQPYKILGWDNYTRYTTNEIILIP
jgi:hypothetical protein